jgi:hypothetical protein
MVTIKKIANYIRKGIKYKAIASFVIFVIIVTKDILVSCFHVIAERSRMNRTISWFIILPLAVIGVLLSILIIREKYFQKAARKNRFIDANLLLALPNIIYVGYFLALLVYSFTL